MTVAVLLPLLIDILAEAPAAIESVQKVWRLFTATTPATTAERAEFDVALAAAHKALQES